jgi:hypothetical protein
MASKKKAENIVPEETPVQEEVKKKPSKSKEEAEEEMRAEAEVLAEEKKAAKKAAKKGRRSVSDIDSFLDTDDEPEMTDDEYLALEEEKEPRESLVTPESLNKLLQMAKKRADSSRWTTSTISTRTFRFRRMISTSS